MTNWTTIRLYCVALITAAATTLAAEPDAVVQPTAAVAKIHLLKQILLADTVEGAQKLSLVPDGPFVVTTGVLKTLDRDELIKRVIAAKDHNIDKPLLLAIEQVFLGYLRQHGFPLGAQLVIPDQNIADGALRVALILGKFREIKFQGNRWTRDSILRDNLHVSSGEIIRFADLDQAISWTNNNNPFRRIKAHVEPVPGSVDADLIVGVEERLPLRFTASIDDSGNTILGREHYIGAISYGNLWGLDHQIAYQYVTTNKGQYFQGHVLTYRAPLPWRHYLQLNTSYIRAQPQLFEGYFNQDAKNISSELRYTIPIRGGDTPVEWFAAINFKESNNNLEFGGTNVLANKTDIFHLTTGVNKMLRDKRGAWIFGANVNLSPGHINSRNSDAAFNDTRVGAKASYSYASFSFQRLLTLERGWELSSRGVLQLSGGNLLSSEQLSIGGSSTVRGFNESVFTGDEGFVFSNDLMAPALQNTLPFFPKGKLPPMQTRFLLFYDAANVRNKHAVALDPHFTPLASTGVGLRTNWANNFSLSADYGWQITHLPYAVTEHGRGHVKVTLAY